MVRASVILDGPAQIAQFLYVPTTVTRRDLVLEARVACVMWIFQGLIALFRGALQIVLSTAFALVEIALVFMVGEVILAIH